jgi:hypothetical protein
LQNYTITTCFKRRYCKTAIWNGGWGTYRHMNMKRWYGILTLSGCCSMPTPGSNWVRSSLTSKVYNFYELVWR